MHTCIPSMAAGGQALWGAEIRWIPYHWLIGQSMSFRYCERRETVSPKIKAESNLCLCPPPQHIHLTTNLHMCTYIALHIPQSATHMTYQQSAHPHIWNLPPRPPILQAMRTVMKNELATGHGWVGGLHLISFITVLLMVWCLGEEQGETTWKVWEWSIEVGNPSWDPRTGWHPFVYFCLASHPSIKEGRTRETGCLKHGYFFKNRLTWEKTLEWNNLTNHQSGAFFGSTRGFEGS